MLMVILIAAQSSIRYCCSLLKPGCDHSRTRKRSNKRTWGFCFARKEQIRRVQIRRVPLIQRVKTRKTVLRHRLLPHLTTTGENVLSIQVLNGDRKLDAHMTGVLEGYGVYSRVSLLEEDGEF